MERLTYDCCLGDIHCWHVKGADNLECRQVCEEQEENGCKGCPIALAFDRLAAYEDTGLTPEEVQQMRWIPVEGRLPETGTVLATDGRAVITAPSSSVTSDGQAITHWMPLPQPPKEASHD